MLGRWSGEARLMLGRCLSTPLCWHYDSSAAFETYGVRFGDARPRWE